MNKITEKTIVCLTGALIHLTIQLPFIGMLIYTISLWNNAKPHSIQWSTYYHCVIQVSIGLLVFSRIYMLYCEVKKITDFLDKYKSDKSDECPE